MSLTHFLNDEAEADHSTDDKLADKASLGPPSGDKHSHREPRSPQYISGHSIYPDTDPRVTDYYSPSELRDEVLKDLEAEYLEHDASRVRIPSASFHRSNTGELSIHLYLEGELGRFNDSHVLILHSSIPKDTTSKRRFHFTPIQEVGSRKLSNHSIERRFSEDYNNLVLINDGTPTNSQIDSSSTLESENTTTNHRLNSDRSISQVTESVFDGAVSNDITGRMSELSPLINEDLSAESPPIPPTIPSHSYSYLAQPLSNIDENPTGLLSPNELIHHDQPSVELFTVDDTVKISCITAPPQGSTTHDHTSFKPVQTPHAENAFTQPHLSATDGPRHVFQDTISFDSDGPTARAASLSTTVQPFKCANRIEVDTVNQACHRNRTGISQALKGTLGSMIRRRANSTGQNGDSPSDAAVFSCVIAPFVLKPPPTGVATGAVRVWTRTMTDLKANVAVKSRIGIFSIMSKEQATRLQEIGTTRELPMGDKLLTLEDLVVLASTITSRAPRYPRALQSGDWFLVTMWKSFQMISNSDLPDLLHIRADYAAAELLWDVIQRFRTELTKFRREVSQLREMVDPGGAKRQKLRADIQQQIKHANEEIGAKMEKAHALAKENEGLESEKKRLQAIVQSKQTPISLTGEHNLPSS
ncbi:hypothetical protein RhiJN_09655 [Ceratobasidium sp. AG-Ba]|nr:hypothetical protein RhiJN_09655 [Ceratobasidium sp. AG-Ba]